jgi:hypothetical protein
MQRRQSDHWQAFSSAFGSGGEALRIQQRYIRLRWPQQNGTIERSDSIGHEQFSSRDRQGFPDLDAAASTRRSTLFDSS